VRLQHPLSFCSRCFLFGSSLLNMSYISPVVATCPSGKACNRVPCFPLNSEAQFPSLSLCHLSPLGVSSAPRSVYSCSVWFCSVCFHSLPSFTCPCHLLLSLVPPLTLQLSDYRQLAGPPTPTWFKSASVLIAVLPHLVFPSRSIVSGTWGHLSVL
jgi:hypothetical protein